MATTVDATNVVFQYSTVLTPESAVWKTVVCETDSSADHAVNVQETKTKCGTFTSVDTPTNSITGNGVVNAVPASDEASYKELLSLLNNKTVVLGRYLNLDDGVLNDGDAIFMQGQGRISSLGSSNTEGDLLKFSYGFTFNGAPLLTPPA
jgi:hypothetical protein